MFLISEENAFSYLVNLGFCKPDRPPIEVLPLPGKNLNLHLKFPDSPDWLIKQEIMDQQGCDELFLGEWAVHKLIAHIDRLAPLRTFIPPIAHYDRSAAILVSRFLTQHENLGDYFEVQDGVFDRTIAADLGQRLGMLHRLTFQQQGDRDYLESLYPDIMRSRVPSEFSPLKPFVPEMFGWVRNDALMFFRWYQNQPQVIQALETLAKTWTGCCLTHQDLQFGNWLIQPETRSLQLIDWERFGWGDPLTDLANLLINPLQVWIRSLPPPTAGTWEQRCNAASIPFDVIQPGLIALIDAYFTEFPQVLSTECLPRILQWMGRRLIYEVETSIQYHLPIGTLDANLLHFAQQLILYPDVVVSIFFDRTP
jgi:hypothetical protein